MGRSLKVTEEHQKHLRSLYSLGYSGRDLEKRFREKYQICPKMVYGNRSHLPVFIKLLQKFKAKDGEVFRDYLPYLEELGYKVLEQDALGVIYVEKHKKVCSNCGVMHEDFEELCHICLLTNKKYDYSTRVERILPPEETKDILFGVELEYEGVSVSDVFKTLSGHCLAKSDGSINNGVEVVSKPASVKTHKEMFKRFFEEVSTKAEPNTGMHVHIDKARLTELQRGVIIAFVNNKNNSSQLITIAGRDFTKNRYCKAEPRASLTMGMAGDGGGSRIRGTKYSSVNFVKEKTLEIRVFSSPNTYEEFVAKLEFVEALTKYSSPYVITVTKLQEKIKWNTFKNYVLDNKKQYPTLISFHKELFNQVR